MNKLLTSPLTEVIKYKNCIYYGIIKENLKEEIG